MEDFIFLEKKFNQNGKGKIEGFVENLPFSKIPVLSRKKQIQRGWSESIELTRQHGGSTTIRRKSRGTIGTFK
jgi:hypothetical protein